MREAVGDVWDFVVSGDVICITTNGFVKKSGEAVMGRGIALEAVNRDRLVAFSLGDAIRSNGNHVAEIHRDPDNVWLSYPVKHNWWENADPELIVRSAHELMTWIAGEWPTDEGADGGYVWLPRPGCGNGRLDWANVKPLIEHILDDRFVAVTK